MQSPFFSGIFELVLFALLFSFSALANDLTLLFHERPPYMETKQGELTGLTAEKAIKALNAAKVKFEVREMPAPRQLEFIKDNSIAACGIGWFKNAEREAFAQFSKPIYFDGKQHTLFLASNKKISETDSLEKVLANPQLDLLVKVGYSYGKTLDELLEKNKTVRTFVTLDNIGMLRMLKGGRTDYMFIAKEEAQLLFSQMGFSEKDFKLVVLKGTPNGETRYLMCSKLVAKEILDKINVQLKSSL